MLQEYTVFLNKSKSGLAYFVLIIILIKLLFFFVLKSYNPEAFISPDSISYTSRAAELVKHGEFTFHGTPDIFRVPGYPLLLTPFIMIFGEGNANYVVILQVFLNLLTACIIYTIIILTNSHENNVKKKTARLAFIIVLVDPVICIAEFSILTEIYYTFALVSGFFFLCKYIKFKKWYYIFISGIILSMSAYIRPISVFLTYIIYLILFFYFAKNKDIRSVFFVIIILIINYSIIEQWKIRNQQCYGVKIFSTSASADLYHYIAAAVSARAENNSYLKVQEKYEKDIVSDNPAIQARYNLKRGLEIVLRYPFTSAYIGIKGFLVNMFDPGTSILANRLKLRKRGSNLIYKFNDMDIFSFARYLIKHEKYIVIFTAIGILWVFLFWFFVFRGILVKHLGIIEIILLVIIVYFLCLASGPGSLARYRVPVIPFMAIFAGYGMMNLAKYRFE